MLFCSFSVYQIFHVLVSYYHIFSSPLFLIFSTILPHDSLLSLIWLCVLCYVLCVYQTSLIHRGVWRSSGMWSTCQIVRVDRCKDRFKTEEIRGKKKRRYECNDGCGTAMERMIEERKDGRGVQLVQKSCEGSLYSYHIIRSAEEMVSSASVVKAVCSHDCFTSHFILSSLPPSPLTPPSHCSYLDFLIGCHAMHS